MKRITAAILVMVSSPAFAQNIAPQCFEVVPLRSGAPIPAILVDKCTGHTWALTLTLDQHTKVWSPEIWLPMRTVSAPKNENAQ